VFQKSLLKEKGFSNFWHRYYPSELRHHAINQGEVGLSAFCIKRGFAPVSFVSARSILDSSEFVDFSQDEKFGIWSNHGLAYLDPKLASHENTKLLMKRQFLENNVTHHQGLLASRVLGAPLKLDLFQTGQVTKEGLEDTLRFMGCESVEVDAIMNAMTLKGSHSSKRGMDRIWASYGYI
jgi:hypothetical protein